MNRITSWVTAAAATLTVAAAAPAGAARTLSLPAAQTAAEKVQLRDQRTFASNARNVHLGTALACKRMSSIYVKCTYSLYEASSGKTIRGCDRAVDVRLRSGKPSPVATRRTLGCRP